MEVRIEYLTELQKDDLLRAFLCNHCRFELGPEFISSDDEQYVPLLAWASAKGDKSIVETWFMLGGGVKGENAKAIGLAAKNGHEDIIAILIREGMDVNAYGGRAINAATWVCNPKIVRMLKKAGAITTGTSIRNARNSPTILDELNKH